MDGDRRRVACPISELDAKSRSAGMSINARDLRARCTSWRPPVWALAADPAGSSSPTTPWVVQATPSAATRTGPSPPTSRSAPPCASPTSPGGPGEYFFGNGPSPWLHLLGRRPPRHRPLRRRQRRHRHLQQPHLQPHRRRVRPAVPTATSRSTTSAAASASAPLTASTPSTPPPAPPPSSFAEPPTGSPLPLERRWIHHPRPHGRRRLLHAVATTGGRYVNPNGPPPPPPYVRTSPPSSTAFRINASGTAATITELFDDTFIIRNYTGGTIVTDVRALPHSWPEQHLGHRPSHRLPSAH